jgi:hypothetical protein
MMFIPAACPLEDRSWPEDVDAAKAMFMTEVARIVVSSVSLFDGAPITDFDGLPTSASHLL